MTEIKNLRINKLKDEIFTCTRCSYCREQVSEKEYTYAICPIRENTPGFESFIAKGKMLILAGILKGDLEISPRTAEIFFTCTTCGNCRTHCPVVLNTVKIFETFRQDLQDLELGDPVHIALGKYCIEKNNPYNEPHEKRLDWIPNKDKSHLDKPSNLGYFVGCTSSYRSTEISRAFYQILVENDIGFTILSDEYCCGSPLFRTGQKEAEKLAKHNIERWKQLGIKEIVFTCAGCQKTFEDNYKDLGGNFKIKNYMNLINQLIKEGKIKFTKNDPIRVTYHDPCHSTKKGELKIDYETPREILKQIPGVELVEMKSHKQGSICCGAGGGVKAANPSLALKIATNRLQEVIETKADILVSSCPFCKKNLKDAAEKENLNLEVLDIIELLLNRM
ncbi:MAG: (Fe-S)-binding protein [Candidatus Lokiarchaeota archaeon]|nr:(Fe-S)-binding protein [Candidatus Lokiarchaeota archaeon]